MTHSKPATHAWALHVAASPPPLHSLCAAHPVARNKAYDAEDLTAQYLNQAHVKANMKAGHDITWAACSKEVDVIMGHDVMKSW